MRTFFSRAAAIAAVMFLALVAYGCTGGPAGKPRVSGPQTTPSAAPSGFIFRLSEGRPQTGDAPQLPVASATPLSTQATEALLKRLPPLKTQPADKVPFALRERSLPAPQAGQKIKDAFPPPPTPAVAPSPGAAELQVLRKAPEGEVPLAPHLSVTFSQPMVAVTSHADLAAEGVPVNLTPAPPGQWRWLGTKTLLFDPKERFPMATEYAVEIPGGTASASGVKLDEAVKWTFRTPPPKLVTTFPVDGPVVREPLIFLAFDQKIDAQAMLGFLKATPWAGGNAPKLRLASEDEVAANPDIGSLITAQGEAISAKGGAAAYGERWMVVRPEAPFAADTQIVMAVEPGAPSAEGPLKTKDRQTFSFRTYSPLRVEDHSCDNEACTPLSSWSIRFNNPLDSKVFKPSMVKVTPELPGLRVQAQGSYLSIAGRSAGRTNYSVSLAPEIADEFGQTLGKSVVLTFRVGSAEPSLTVPGEAMVVLDPSGKPGLSVFSVNHRGLRVKITSVGPADWPGFTRFFEDFSYGYRSGANQVPMPGKVVFDKIVPVQGKTDELTETVVDLSPAMHDGLGQAVVTIEPEIQPKDTWRQVHVTRWVQSTRIGLDAFADSSKMIAWATALQDGAPLTGVSVRLFPRGGSAETANSGLAELELPDDPATLLVARLGNDMAIMPRANGLYGGGWQRVSQIDALRWFVFDDRQMYRPGETVHVKGWVRRMGRGPDGDLSLVAGSGPVRFTMLDSRGNEVRKGDAKLSALGGFDFRLSLPKTMNLGSARISLALAAPDAHNVSIDHAFQVQEFRRPEFEVKATASEGPFYLGGHADVSVDAHYYSGGALPNAQVTWNVEAVGSSFTPPNWGEFSFGTWTPWWVYDFGGRPGIAGTSKSFQGKTGADGIHRLRMDFDACRPPRATSVTATATVMDVNRQAWTSSTSVLVHPSKLYVGLKTEKAFVQPGDPIDLQIIVADVDGKAARGTDVSLRLSRREWTWSDGEYRDEEVDVQEKTVVSAAEPAPVSFTVKGGGEYRLIARIVDAEGLPNESEISVWVPGGKQPPQRGVQQEKVTVIPDHKTYKIGDTASLLVQSPIFPAEGLMTVRRNGIARSERFRMEESTITLKVPISEHDLPSLEVAVDLVGAAQRTDDDGSPAPDAPKRPAYATGSVSLAVPPVSRTLTVAAAPKDKALGPGESTSVEVDVKGPDGKPVADAEVAVIVVDEAVLALTGYKLGDPINAFYVAAGGGVTASHLRGSLILVEASTITEGAKPAPGGAANGRSRNGAMDEMKREEYGGGEVMAGAPPPPPAPGPMQEARPVASAAEPAPDQPTTPMAVRSNFDPLATWAPAVKTDANGHASVPVKLPDNLTRYRVMAVAVAEAKFFGTGESSLTARLPLMVRPSAPRFLNFGDQFDLPVVVQNQTDQPLEVQVAVRASNAVLPKGNSLGLTVPANDRVEVRFPAGTDEAGTARFQIGASAGKYSDAAEVSLPVWTPATSEAFATYGEVDQGAVAQPVKAPTDVFKQFGGLEITTSSTQLQALTDAVLYLQAYPFECSEQISSRVLSVAALRDVLTAFMAEGLPTPQVMKAAMARDIERLHGIQNDDGGFPFWRKGDEAWPYVSVHVAHALARAKQKGFEVPLDMQDRCIRYLRNIESYIPHYYGIEARRAIISYALYVRHHLGDDDRPWARKLLREAGVDSLSLESLGWLLEVLTGDAASQSEIAAIRKHINNRVEETASGAHFTTHYSDGQHLLLASDRRTDAVILEALIDDQPKSDLIPKIVRDLLAHRVKGRWENTQENCFVLLALDKYFNKYEKVTPNFTARVWLGDRFAGSAAFKGRTIDEHEIDIPMAFLMEGPALRNLIIGKDGPGRLYYRIGMQYAPTDLNPPPADHGFTVERVYEAVDKPEDVRRDQDGTWHVKAGAAVRVRVTMVAPTRRHHVALVDPLPAGLEVLNPALAVTGPVPRDPKAASSNYWFWLGTWYEHQNLRDDRAEAFTSLLWEGVYDYTYVARATTPGRYVVPPPKAEEMYHPETFGRGPANVLVVE